ncbi:hypothetical protein L380_01589 [Enterobacter roggenkampii MGH 34]|nr:hypothetical protein L380_01589 [Enterobacter roggenkampii MGH 34]
MTGKTKAAMPGRQCNTALQKHRQITRLAAGGQTLSRRNPYAQINRVRLTYGDRDKGEQYSGSWQNNVKRGLEAPTKNVESCEDNQPSLRGEPLHNSLIVAQNRPFLRGAVHSITGSNPVQLSDSDLDFLRCRRLISPSIAEVTNCPVLSPSAFRFSIASTKQSGTRASIRFDLAFTDLVAICGFRCIWCPTIIIERKYNSSLDVSHTLLLACVPHLDFGKVRNGNAPGCRSSTEASNHNVNRSNIMACIQHTQTRPKYQYRFLALSAIGRNVIHITATTEREAREQSPAGCVMVFAGRLPVREGRHA